MYFQGNIKFSQPSTTLKFVLSKILLQYLCNYSHYFFFIKFQMNELDAFEVNPLCTKTVHCSKSINLNYRRQNQ